MLYIVVMRINKAKSKNDLDSFLLEKYTISW